MSKQSQTAERQFRKGYLQGVYATMEAIPFPSHNFRHWKTQVEDWSPYFGGDCSQREQPPIFDFKAVWTYILWFEGPSEAIDGVVKIGRSSQPDKRLQTLRKQFRELFGNAATLLLMPQDIEGQLHAKFRRDRVEREIFRFSKSIQNYVFENIHSKRCYCPLNANQFPTTIVSLEKYWHQRKEKQV